MSTADRQLWPAILTILTLMSGAALAQQDARQEPAGGEELADQDVDFAHHAARGGMLEIQLGKLAAEQGQRSEVQQFGQRMVQDHQKAAQKLKSIAGKLGLDLPQELPETMQSLKSSLDEVSGDLFDREYIWNMVAAHTVAVNVFEEQVQNGTNPQLVKFAETALPTLREHREKAIEIWRDLG